jgi:hypothetical protein
MPLLETRASGSALAYGLNSFIPDFDAFFSIDTKFGDGTNAQFNFSIPQTYAHLQLRYFARTTYASGPDTLYIYGLRNGGGESTNSSYHSLTYDGSAAGGVTGTGSYSAVNALVPGLNQTSGVFGAGYVDILDYSVTGKQKTIRCFGGYDANGSGVAGLYGNTPISLGTNAINTLSVLFNSPPVVGSYFALYGVK